MTREGEGERRCPEEDMCTAACAGEGTRGAGWMESWETRTERLQDKMGPGNLGSGLRGPGNDMVAQATHVVTHLECVLPARQQHFRSPFNFDYFCQHRVLAK